MLTSLLTRARELIEKGYCKGLYAVNKKGRTVSVSSRAACAWCLEGAAYQAEIEHAVTRGHPQLIPLLESHLPQEHRGKTVSAWNDEPTTTQSDVLALLDRAIAGVAQ
jgi:hypothetical protein